MTSLLISEPPAILATMGISRAAGRSDVFWRHGRIIDDDAGGLAASLNRMGRDIIDLGGRPLCDGGDAVQKCEKATHLIDHSRLHGPEFWYLAAKAAARTARKIGDRS